MGHFWAQNKHFVTFLKIVPDDRHKKVGKSDGNLRKFFIMSKNGGNRSSGITRGLLLLSI